MNIRQNDKMERCGEMLPAFRNLAIFSALLNISEALTILFAFAIMTV